MKPFLDGYRATFLRSHIGIAAVVTVAIALRVVAFMLLPDSLDADPDAYRQIAVSLSQTGTFGLVDAQGIAHPTAFRPPLYPWLLSWFVAGTHLNQIAVVWLHAIIGGFTAGVAVLASRRLIGGNGLLAGTLVAIDPVLVQQSTLVMTETLAALLGGATIAWWATRLDRGRPIEFGLLLGGLLALAYLCRPTFMAWAVLLLLASLFASGRFSARCLRTLLVGLVLLITAGAWMLRNERQFGRPMWATSHGGYTLLLANNPMFYEYLQNRSLGEVWDAESFFLAWSHRYDGDVRSEEFFRQDWSSTPESTIGGTEIQDDDLASAAAKAVIVRQPAMFVWSCIVRLGRLWSPLPHVTGDRSRWLVFAVGGYYVVIYLLCAVGLWRLGWQVLQSPWWAFWLLVITLSAVHAVYWSNLRMRSPATCGVATLAAAALLPPRKSSPPG